jgi:N-acetylglutamate synthase-like GNAT family acetyltransferase
MDTYSLQPATQEDFPAIRALIRAVQINPTGLDSRRFWVAKLDNGSIIGCGQIKPHNDGTQELASIAVVSEFRRQGVGGAIIRKLLENHPDRLYLTCRSSLGTYYERFGFEKVAQEQMPPYFKRISRLASVIMKVGHTGDSLLVMRRG